MKGPCKRERKSRWMKNNTKKRRKRRKRRERGREGGREGGREVEDEEKEEDTTVANCSCLELRVGFDHPHNVRLLSRRAATANNRRSLRKR